MARYYEVTLTVTNKVKNTVGTQVNRYHDKDRAEYCAYISRYDGPEWNIESAIITHN